MTHTQQLKDTGRMTHGVCYGIQCKHKEWTFNHQNLSAQKDSLSHI